MKLIIAVLSCLLPLSLADDINSRNFPEYFKFGVANAATQIEGAWDEDGKGETIWDHFAHNYPEKISDQSTADIACDSYHKYKEDVAMIKAMGLDYYRLSIAWSRILPTGYPDEVNDLGVQYYKNLFAELKANDIEPMVTLYHWDLPQSLEEDLGGWLNITVTDLFAEYARICFRLFGDDVKVWLTINEPKQVCQSGYGWGGYAPGVVSNGIGEYICARNVIIAHAKVYHIFHEEFDIEGGKISMVIDSNWYESVSDSEADLEATERQRQFSFGLYANAIFIGNWPQVVIDRVAYRSNLEGFETSRLPAFSDEEIDYINGTYDFLALNHYSTGSVRAFDEDVAIGDPGYWADIGVWTGDYHAYPLGFRHFLGWLKDTYGEVEIIVTENGYSETNGTLEDDKRVSYFQTYLSAALDAIFEDDSKLTAYVAWSIMDDWEWTGGYSSFLGMYHVNFSDPERTRTPRKSASFFTQMVKTRCLVDTCTE